MDEKLRETTNLGREVMNSKRQIKRKLGHVVQIRICVDVNVMLNSLLITQCWPGGASEHNGRKYSLKI